MRVQDMRMLPIYFHTAILLTLLPQWILSSAVPPGRTETYLKSFSLTHAVRGSEGGSGHWRSKRSLPLDELTFLVDDHNAKRRMEPSSDMEHMVSGRVVYRPGKEGGGAVVEPYPVRYIIITSTVKGSMEVAAVISAKVPGA